MAGRDMFPMLALEVPPSLRTICTRRLASLLVKHGSKKVRFARLSGLPRPILESLLELLVSKNALSDNVLMHALSPQIQRLCLEGASQIRRFVLNTIGRSCPNLRVLDVRACHQVDNRIARDVLQHCECLEVLRLDGCFKISDSAFSPALWKPPLVGLLGLRELTVAKIGQITAEGLMGCVMKGAPLLRTLGVSHCRLAISDDVASELFHSFDLTSVDLSFCAQISDVPFQVPLFSSLRELNMSHTAVTDAAVESFAPRAPHLEVFIAGGVVRLGDRGVSAVLEACERLRTLCVSHTSISDAAFASVRRSRSLQWLDASWCLSATSRALFLLVDGDHPRPPLRDLQVDHLGAQSLLFGCPAGSFAHSVASTTAGVAVSTEMWRASPRRLQSGSPKLMSWPGHRGPAAADLAALSARGVSSSGEDIGLGDVSAARPSARAAESTAGLHGKSLFGTTQVEQIPMATVLLKLVHIYTVSLERLSLADIRDVVDAAALEAIAASCPSLRELALTLPPAPRSPAASPHCSPPTLGLRSVRQGVAAPGQPSSSPPHLSIERPHQPKPPPPPPPWLLDWPAALAAPVPRQTPDAAAGRPTGSATAGCSDAALAAGLRAIGATCRRLESLSLDVTWRPHSALLGPLELPFFAKLTSLALWCSKGGGLTDGQLELILTGRLGLEALALHNCEGLSENLFPHWCNRSDKLEEAEVVEQLDRVLFSTPMFGMGGPVSLARQSKETAPPAPKPAARRPRRKHLPRSPAAVALRAVRTIVFSGASALTDRSCDALAELLHCVQTVEIRGGPLLTEESLRSFRRGCRHLRSAAVVTRERTLAWTASASTVRKHHRHTNIYASGSSETESN